MPEPNARAAATSALDMLGLVEAMEKRLFARVQLADADYGALVQNKLEREALAAFREELRQVPPAESLAWLVGRMARLEARVDALTRALHERQGEEEPFAPPPPAVELDRCAVLLDEAVVQQGFHLTERSQEGAPYRWLGPSPVARVYLPKVRRPLEVRLFLVAVYRGIDIAAIRVALNDGPRVPVALDSLDGAVFLRARPASGPGGDGLLHHIDIDCGATFSPADEGGADSRRLGIALSRIELDSLD